MAAKNIEFKVGIVILVGAALVALSLIWLQGYNIEQKSRRVTVHFQDVGTLAVGDRVTVSGVRRGKVEELELVDRGVDVTLLLSRDVKLMRDASFTIKNQGLMGERFVAITPGRDSITLDTSVTVDGSYDSGLPEVMGLLGEMIVELRQLVASLKSSLGTDTTLNKFTTTLDNMQRVSGSLADYMERHRDGLDETAVNFLRVSRSLDRLVTRTGPKIDSTMVSFERTSRNAEVIAARLDTVSIAAREFATLLENPDGTVQLLLEDRKLYDDLRQTADDIDDLVNDIRANPRKYINLTVEIF